MNAGKAARAAQTPAAVALAEKIYTSIRLRMQAERGNHGFDRKRLAELRTFIASLVADAGPHADQAYAEAASIYTTNLPGDWGDGLLRTFHSVAAEMIRCGTEPAEPPALETDAPTPDGLPEGIEASKFSRAPDEPAPDESPGDEPGGRILFRATTRHR
jgi:hypothetical protein